MKKKDVWPCGQSRTVRIWADKFPKKVLGKRCLVGLATGPRLRIRVLKNGPGKRPGRR